MKRKYAISMLLNSYVQDAQMKIQKRILEKLGISHPTWVRWLNLTQGDSYEIRPHTLQVIADELKVTVEQLLITETSPAKAS